MDEIHTLLTDVLIKAHEEGGESLPTGAFVLLGVIIDQLKQQGTSRLLKSALENGLVEAEGAKTSSNVFRQRLKYINAHLRKTRESGK